MLNQRLKNFNLYLGTYLTRFQWLSFVIASLFATGTLVSLKKSGILEPLELFVFDKFTQYQTHLDREQDLLFVEITETDIQTYGWPISDQVLSNMLSQLQDASPSVIGLDLYREITHPPGTDSLRQHLQADNLIAIQLIGENQDNSDIPAPLVVDPQRVGFNDLVLDRDGVVRRGLLFVDGPESNDFYSFALRVSLKFLESTKPNFHASEVLHVNEAVFTPLRATSGGYQKLDHRGYQTLLRYRPLTDLGHHISIDQLLNGQFEPEWVEGKVVLIGTTAPSIKDLFYTPYSLGQTSHVQMPGVAIHGQIISQILDAVSGQRAMYWFWPQWLEILWLSLWTTAGVMWVWRSRHPIVLTALSLVSIVSIVGAGWLSFSYLGWIPVAEPVLGLAVAIGFTLAQRLFYSTSRDQLTGLLNQSSFLHHLQLWAGHHPPIQSTDLPKNSEFSASSVSSAVLYLNLDRFKLINGSLGIRAGNRILREVVYRLHERLPFSSLLARVGGDEFAILLRNIDQQQIFEISDQLQASLVKPFSANGQNALISASIGIALIEPQHYYNADQILRNAQTAMYRAKNLGKARYEVFADSMFLDVAHRLQLESDLLRGLHAAEFELHYQPIICFKSGTIKGFESLVRWKHPEQGFVSPGVFIPIAEETGLIVPLGLWIFQEACRQLKQWITEIPAARYLMMSINLSSRQFEQPDLIDQLQSTLNDLGMGKHADAIKLEITESMVMGDVDEAIDMMLRLKKLKFKLSIDDFGTGYSSLSYLHRFPIDTLKVDQSFVRRMAISSEDCAIVDTIITLGHKLSMDVIAEGIETEEQMYQLHDLGCEYGQGYFFSKPLSAKLATDLLRKDPCWLCQPTPMSVEHTASSHC